MEQFAFSEHPLRQYEKGADWEDPCVPMTQFEIKTGNLTSSKLNILKSKCVLRLKIIVIATRITVCQYNEDLKELQTAPSNYLGVRSLSFIPFYQVSLFTCIYVTTDRHFVATTAESTKHSFWSSEATNGVPK
jgi:hypothetical protein